MFLLQIRHLLAEILQLAFFLLIQRADLRHDGAGLLPAIIGARDRWQLVGWLGFLLPKSRYWSSPIKKDSQRSGSSTGPATYSAK